MNARVRLIGQALQEYNKLKEAVKKEIQQGLTSSSNQSLLRSIEQKTELLKENPLAGEVVKKGKIPRDLDADNLFKMRLSNFWRMLYTIRREEIDIFCFVLVIESHEKYDKRFSVKKR
ncbi:hypothetical protein KKG83_02710 [Candidatus Micrarchaeota archaeon]|nr:hypothetical protein [Candidatus Micrarchaeota archaeon]MBU2476358.1 hypothetical protein [Candidatus Micrarchaeota archaeon]